MGNIKWIERGVSAKATLQLMGSTFPIHITTVGDNYLCGKVDCWLCDLIKEEWQRVEYMESVKGFWVEAYNE